MGPLTLLPFIPQEFRATKMLIQAAGTWERQWQTHSEGISRGSWTQPARPQKRFLRQAGNHSSFGRYLCPVGHRSVGCRTYPTFQPETGRHCCLEGPVASLSLIFTRGGDREPVLKPTDTRLWQTHVGCTEATDGRRKRLVLHKYRQQPRRNTARLCLPDPLPGPV